jgi:hypothetical protein
MNRQSHLLSLGSKIELNRKGKPYIVKVRQHVNKGKDYPYSSVWRKGLQPMVTVSRDDGADSFGTLFKD